MPTKFKYMTPLGSWEKDRKSRQKPSQAMPLRLKTTRNISTVSLQVESRPTTPYQHQHNQAEGVNRAGAEPQQQQRIPTENANVFIKVLQSLQHLQQQIMEEICQMKADKTNEKGSQHDLEHAIDKEETPV